MLRKHKVVELSNNLNAKRQRIETQAFNMLRDKFPNEYKDLFAKVSAESTNLSWRQKKQRTITLLKQAHRVEWREAFNEVAQQEGWSTAEARREKVIAKAVADLEKLKNTPLRVTKVEQ